MRWKYKDIQRKKQLILFAYRMSGKFPRIHNIRDVFLKVKRTLVDEGQQWEKEIFWAEKIVSFLMSQ